MPTDCSSKPVERHILYATPVANDEDCACSEHLLIAQETYDQEAENDCACDVSGTGLFGQPLLGNLYQQAPGMVVTNLSSSYRMVLSPVSPFGPVVVDETTWLALEEHKQAKPIATPLEKEMVRAGLLTKIGLPPSPKGIPETLTAWLHVTNACNLECPYCYVQKSSASMSMETGRKAIAAIFKTAQQHNFRSVKLKYAGGEATLHFRLIHALHEEAAAFAKQTGLTQNEVILSNGTRITENEANWLTENNIRLMISVDGTGEVHNRTRSDRRQRGTFIAVERTVDQVLIPRGIRPTISITVTGLNAEGIADTVRWSLARRLPISINFYRQLAGVKASKELDLEEDRIIAGMCEAYQVIEEHLPDRPMINGLLDRVRFGAHQMTCGVGHGYLVVDHLGQLAQCHMQLHQPVQAELSGDLLLRTHGRGIQNLPVDEKADCMACTYRYFCAGGCPLESYRNTGRWDASSPKCRIYQALIPLLLRLEGLRLMKTNDLSVS